MVQDCTWAWAPAFRHQEEKRVCHVMLWCSVTKVIWPWKPFETFHYHVHIILLKRRCSLELLFSNTLQRGITGAEIRVWSAQNPENPSTDSFLIVYYQSKQKWLEVVYWFVNLHGKSSLVLPEACEWVRYEHSAQLIKRKEKGHFHTEEQDVSLKRKSLNCSGCIQF